MADRRGEGRVKERVEEEERV
jgi:hypothetical protein